MFILDKKISLHTEFNIVCQSEILNFFYLHFIAILL